MPTTPARRRGGTVALLALIGTLLAGCSSASDEAAPSAPAPEETTSAAPADVAPAIDRTEELQDAVGDVVVSAEEVEEGRINVMTSLVDPRTDNSAEAAEAIAVCEAAVELGATYVAVAEEDGSTWILYGHPTTGDTCTEV